MFWRFTSEAVIFGVLSIPVKHDAESTAQRRAVLVNKAYVRYVWPEAGLLLGRVNAEILEYE